MNYVNKTVDKSEPSFPDNLDGKAEFLYGVINEETESRYTLFFRSTVTVVRFWANMMDGGQPMFVFFSKLNNFCFFKLAPEF